MRGFGIGASAAAIAAIEERLRDSGIKWVILRPGLFMQNVLGQAASIKNDGKMVMSFPRICRSR